MLKLLFRKYPIKIALLAIGVAVFHPQKVTAILPPPPPDGPPAPVLSSIAISGPVSVDEESTAQYACTATYSDGSTAVVNAAWSEDSAYASIDSLGVLTAGNVDADAGVVITASYGGKIATVSVTINYVAPTLTGITISGPANVDEETSAQYNCVAIWSDGTTTTVSPSWTENSSYASISSGGLLSAANVASDQVVTISADYGGKSDTYAVTIKYVVPTLNGITIVGPSSLDEETTAQYSCTANWSDGTTTMVTPSWDENSSYASISASGLLTAGDVVSDQNVTVSASYNGMSDTHAVVIQYVQPTLDSITISGPFSLDEQTTAQYSCTANWSDNTTTTITPSWSENSPYATISASGLLSAGDVTSDQSVTISASYSGQTDTLVVGILYVKPPVVVTGISITGPSEVDENSTASYSCTATYSDGTTATVMPVWSENAGFATIDAAGTLTVGNIEADAGITVTATFDGYSDSQVVTVWMVGTQVVYALSGFEGQTVWARLWDDYAQTWYDLGEMTSPDELVVGNVNPNQWYWISIKVYNELTGTWDKVQSNWLNM